MSHFGKQYSGSDLERLSSSDEAREAYVTGSACASRGTAADCAELLQELSNVLGSMVMNAQVMQWKLPAYSHSKRYVREIERGAQRGGSLVKQLMRRIGDGGSGGNDICGEGPSLEGLDDAVAAQEPTAGSGLANLPRNPVPAAPAFSRNRPRLSHTSL